MQVIPVMDLLDGLIVRAYRGERNKYRPMESPLVNSPHPVKVAKALLYVTGGNDLSFLERLSMAMTCLVGMSLYLSLSLVLSAM